MENDFAQRRKALQELVQSFGRGGIARLAKELDVNPTYVSRMLSSPDSKQHRQVTGDMVLKITAMYPYWLTGNTHGTKETATARESSPTERETKALADMIAKLPSNERKLLVDFLKARVQNGASEQTIDYAAATDVEISTDSRLTSGPTKNRFTKTS